MDITIAGRGLGCVVPARCFDASSTSGSWMQLPASRLFASQLRVSCGSARTLIRNVMARDGYVGCVWSQGVELPMGGLPASDFDRGGKSNKGKPSASKDASSSKGNEDSPDAATRSQVQPHATSDSQVQPPANKPDAGHRKARCKPDADH